MSVCIVQLAASLALAASTLGSGRDGELRVHEGITVVNRATALLAPAPAGALTLSIEPIGFSAGDLALVLQTTERAPPDAGALSDMASSQVGRFEWVRVEAVGPDGLRLAAPLALDFLEGTQVVFVPQYRSVVVADGGILSANPWDGRAGGVVAFVVNGPLQNDGVVSATGLGFRGGAWTDVYSHCGNVGDPAQGPPGEGVWGHASWPWRGRPSGTGGSGCYCASAGGVALGAGGGNAGRGGSVPGNVSGGLALRAGPQRLVLGGGGGAGSCLPEERAGGRGGGVVWVRAREIEGSGRFAADGARAPGSGGSGAGGTVDVRAAGALACGQASATGGQARRVANGGCSGDGSPGGGGRVSLQAASLRCTARASAGAPDGTGSVPQDPEDPEYRGTIDVTQRALELDEASSGSGADAGATNVPQRHLEVGCGCGAGAPPSVLAALACAAALAVAFPRALRRRRRA